MADFAETIDPTSILDAGNTESNENEVVDPQDDPEVDQPSDDTTSDDPDAPADGEDTPSDEDESEEGEEPKDKSASKGDDDIDLRKAEPKLRKALQEFRDSNPENKALAKILRNAVGHDLAYQESFKSPQDARVFKASVDAIGGTEGLATLQETASRFQEQETLSESGDPALVKNYAKDFPDGFKKAAPVVLDELKTLDNEAFKKVILPHLVDSLEASNLPGVLTELVNALESSDTATAKKIAGNVLAWLGSQSAAAKNLRTSAVNPEADKLAEREKALNDREEAGFNKQWKTAVGNQSSTLMWKAGEPYIRNVPVGQQRAFFQEIISEIDRRLTGDKTYTKQEEALMKSKNRDINKIVQFKNAKIATLVDDSVAKIAKDFGFTAGGQKTGGKPAVKPGQKQNAPAGNSNKSVVGPGSTPQNPIYVKERPPEADRDTARKDAINFQIAGKSFMKSGPFKGKWVSWRPKPQV